MGDGGGSQTAGAGAGCRVRWVMRTGVRARASGVGARFPWCRVCLPLPVLWLVSCVVHGRVLALSRLRG